MTRLRDTLLSLTALAIVVLASYIANYTDEPAPSAPTPSTEPAVTIVAIATIPPAPIPEPEEAKPPIPLPDELVEALYTACEADEVPVALALAVMEQESGFEAEAVGWDGHDVGLFQIRDSNHAWLQEETGADPLTPAGNIMCGVWFLAYLYDYAGDWPAALTCWRWGPGHGEASEYAKAVLERTERWKEVLEWTNG